MSNLVWIDEAACSKLYNDILTTRWSNMPQSTKDVILCMTSTLTSNNWFIKNNIKYRGFSYTYEYDLSFNGRYYISALDKSFNNTLEVEDFIDYFYDNNDLAKVLYE